MKINLGCGRDQKVGYVNVDIVKEEGVDLIWDLNNFPYPFEDNSIDEVLAKDIIEHVEDAKSFIEELWRICKPHTKIYIKTAHYSGSVAWTDLTHVRPFAIDSFKHYNVDNNNIKSLSLYSSDVGCKVKFKTEGKFLLNWFYKMIGLEILFNKYTRLYERVFSGIFPCGLIEFNIEVIKDSQSNGKVTE